MTAPANKNFLTIVSGLPRSGTSMMMRMMETGGLPVMIDLIREADDDNPNGYYEFEAVKHTKEDASWLDDSDGKVVKMVYRLLYDLPEDRTYYVLFMGRHLDEVLASQRVMLERHGNGADGITDAQMRAMFQAEIDKFFKWIADRPCFKMIRVDYNNLLADPKAELTKVNEFLGGGLDVEAMAATVDPSLYRNRKAEAVAS
ncbi:sulfotransferase domain-containing protein [Aeoliella sp. SH292]|uniref:sulfotransferase domain-containing protein n=1 Tax=Aeoliella sp. SH292 TaxID=3454464 RepID=UPI003F9D1CDE